MNLCLYSLRVPVLPVPTPDPYCSQPEGRQESHEYKTRSITADYGHWGCEKNPLDLPVYNCGQNPPVKLNHSSTRSLYGTHDSAHYWFIRS